MTSIASLILLKSTTKLSCPQEGKTKYTGTAYLKTPNYDKNILNIGRVSHTLCQSSVYTMNTKKRYFHLLNATWEADDSGLSQRYSTEVSTDTDFVH